MITIATFYFVCAFLLAVYGINTHILVKLFSGHYPGRIKTDKAFLADFYSQNSPIENISEFGANLPTITTQLPVFNEMNVVERLIDAVAAFHYPEGRHEIQVLDDSTDKTREIVAAKVQRLRKLGVDIHHITRDERSGFKAGALRAGLEMAQGDFVAIFDADFVPPPDFLLRAMLFFIDNVDSN